MHLWEIIKDLLSVSVSHVHMCVCVRAHVAVHVCVYAYKVNESWLLRKKRIFIFFRKIKYSNFEMLLALSYIRHIANA